MDRELIDGIVLVLATGILATIGWLVKSRLEDIAADSDATVRLVGRLTERVTDHGERIAVLEALQSVSRRADRLSAQLRGERSD